MAKDKLLSWVAVLVWMAVIFYLSSQAAEDSNQLSTGITRLLTRLVAAVAPGAQLDLELFNHLVRKGAHFTAYLILGVLSSNALKVSGVKSLQGLALALAVCFLYAAGDEVHQLFVPGRAGQLRDVLLDGAGALVGIGLYYALGRLVIKLSIRS